MVLADRARPRPTPGRRAAPPSVPRAIVVGLDHINGLQVARILAERGVPVVGVARDMKHVCCRTRLPERILQADTSSEALIDELERLGPTLGARAVLFPAADQQVRLLSKHRDRLAPWFHVVLPDHDVVELLMDKARFTAYAIEHGLPVPPTAFVRDRADVERAAATFAFPCILKPTSSAEPVWDANSPRKAFLVGSPEELLDLYDRYGRFASLLLVQGWIEGTSENLYSCNAYFAEGGRPVTTFVARKLRQWPPETGDSCFGEEVRNDAVRDLTVRLFGDLGFHGLAYLEVKRDERTGEHLIVEPNVGRPTGRSAIAEAGGVPLHYAMYADALGLPLPDGLQQRYGGARWRYFRRDLQSAAWHIRRGDLTVGGYLRSLRGRTRDALFSWRDPMPFVADVLASIGGKAIRGRGARGSDGAREVT
jgi:predicted ATP-grasp superfamily ATP-dependent carboligase